MTRHKLLLPIVLGVLAILFTIAIIVGWNVMFTKYYTLNKQVDEPARLRAWYWVILSIGDVFLVTIMATVVTFLIGNIRREILVARQNTFIDSVTHELKSPLASLRLALDTFQLRDPPPEMRDRFIELMKNDVDRLQTFIHRVLEAGRLEHGESELKHEPIDLAGACADAIETIRARHALTDEIRFIDHYGDEAVPYPADAVALSTILTNLLDNAVKYSSGKVIVELTLARDAEGRPRIAVRDHGVGIPRGKQRTIFARFTRLSRPQDKEVRGTGLGLYLAYALVRRLGGRIWAESEGEGMGATFHVQLPVHDPDAAPDPTKDWPWWRRAPHRARLTATEWASALWQRIEDAPPAADRG